MYFCVLVDIVLVSSEEPVEADQEQVFEEEPVFKQGRQVVFSPCMILFYPI
jgi:hypothetical protein